MLGRGSRGNYLSYKHASGTPQVSGRQFSRSPIHENGIPEHLNHQKHHPNTFVSPNNLEDHFPNGDSDNASDHPLDEMAESVYSQLDDEYSTHSNGFGTQTSWVPPNNWHIPGQFNPMFPGGHTTYLKEPLKLVLPASIQKRWIGKIMP